MVAESRLHGQVINIPLTLPLRPACLPILDHPNHRIFIHNSLTNFDLLPLLRRLILLGRQTAQKFLPDHQH